MPITKTASFMTSDGALHANIGDARRFELAALLRPVLAQDPSDAGIASALIEESEKVIDILTTGPRSRPSTRKKAGTTAPRRARARAATPVEAVNGFKAMRDAVDAPQESETTLETGR